MAGFFAPWLVYALLLALHALVPARSVAGYVRDAETGEPLRYRLNGLRVLGVTLLAWAAVCRAGWLRWDWFFAHRWESAAGACALGLLFTFAIVLSAPSTGKGLLAELYLGRLENPRWAGGFVDAKMFLYLAGAVMLELNVLSSAARHVLHFGEDANPGVVLHALLFSFFLCEYLFFEEVHLYTYDLFAERVGFKLGWGCLVFYPYFYNVGLWSAATQRSPGQGALWLTACGLCFFSGWVLSRGANLQKYSFKRNPRARYLGLFAQEALSDGERKLLVNGFWGLSRHINYLGEVLMALGLALSLGRPSDPWPWLYPLYYVALLVPRQLDDDKRCAEKYGALWEEYCRRVPYRIIPGVY